MTASVRCACVTNRTLTLWIPLFVSTAIFIGFFGYYTDRLVESRRQPPWTVTPATLDSGVPFPAMAVCIYAPETVVDVSMIPPMYCATTNVFGSLSGCPSNLVWPSTSQASYLGTISHGASATVNVYCYYVNLFAPRLSYSPTLQARTWVIVGLNKDTQGVILNSSMQMFLFTPKSGLDPNTLTIPPTPDTSGLPYTEWGWKAVIQEPQGMTGVSINVGSENVVLVNPNVYKYQNTQQSFTEFNFQVSQGDLGTAFGPEAAVTVLISSSAPTYLNFAETPTTLSEYFGSLIGIAGGCGFAFRVLVALGRFLVDRRTRSKPQASTTDTLHEPFLASSTNNPPVMQSVHHEPPTPATRLLPHDDDDENPR